VPKPELGADAVIWTSSAMSCWLSAGVGWPGMIVVYDLPVVRVPLAGVLPVLDANVTVLILCALASATNWE
jgi:hypothetical protein